MTDENDFRQMTAESMGVDLLQALVTELKLLPKPWPELSKAKQDDIIDRLRARVEHNVKMAVHVLTAAGRIVVAGDLDSITIKDGVKAVVKFGPSAEGLSHLYDAAGKAVLIVVANPEEHLGGMGDVQGEADQRAMDLGHEYKPNSDGDGMGGETIEGDVQQLPDLGPTMEERQKAWDDGYQAAQDGKPREACPTMAGELCIEWCNGWQTWHDEQAAAA